MKLLYKLYNFLTLKTYKLAKEAKQYRQQSDHKLWAEDREKYNISLELTKKRPLPLGRAELDVWLARIIGGACIPGATFESLAFACCEMIAHIPPNEAFVEDGKIINMLRKSAANQVAFDKMTELRNNVKARLLAEQEALKTNAEATVSPESVDDGKVLLFPVVS